MYSKKNYNKGRRLNKTRRNFKRKKSGGHKRSGYGRKRSGYGRKRSSSKRSRMLTMRKHKHTKRCMHGGSNMWPLIGSPYNAGDAEPQGNYYGYNQKVEAWPSPTNQNMRGGGVSEFVTTLLPQEIVNIGRSIPAGIGHMYDKFNGALSSPSSMVYPTQQPLASTGSSADLNNRMMTPPDIAKLYKESNNAVSRI